MPSFRLVLALVVSAGVVLSSPFIRDIRDWIRGTFPGQYATVVATAVAISIGLALIAAIIRIRDRRALRYGALACALVLGTAYALWNAQGIAEVDAVERVHFVEYGLITFLFYRVWRPLGDVSMFVMPLLAGLAVGTLEGQIFETLTTPRFRAVLLAGFAAIALLLATIGIYGVTAHAVGQRTHEVGIRMALGAAGRDVLGLILAQHLKPALIGVAVGVAGAIILSRSLRTLVYGIKATDPMTFIAMGIALIAVTIVACWIPALRATRVDPLVALRAE